MKMTREERSWVLYDVGNSAFVLLVSTIMPLYFNHLAGSAGLSDSDYLAYWGYAASIATIIVAVMGPVVGTMADMKGFKKILFTISMLVRSGWVHIAWICKAVACFSWNIHNR